MPRSCSVCNLAEHLMVINQRLRAGESQIAIAQNFALSVDAVQRHASRHLNPKTAGNASRMALLQARHERASALFEHAIATGDTRLADSVLGRLDKIEESMSKQQTSSASNFESLPVSEQVCWILQNKPLFQALLDAQVVWYDSATARRQEQEAELAAYNERTRRVVEALETRGQQADSKP